MTGVDNPPLDRRYDRNVRVRKLMNFRLCPLDIDGGLVHQRRRARLDEKIIQGQLDVRSVP